MTTTLMDRFVRWNLDADGDLYGRDERERQRWYEASTVMAQVQSIAVPWAAAALVWAVGEPVAKPLVLVLAAILLPVMFTSIWVQTKRVDTVPREWTGKRLLVSTLLGLPYLVFIIGYLFHVYPESTMWRSALIGAVLGGAAGGIAQAVHTRRARRRDAVPVGDED
ncbi:hypothetical protein [Actinoplanes sp. G11-F43]|uniref:hypothetical protein n=1 Tax=Actinoplanes sp. G11-F43 TaxID=3424130 RepID=UPI003D3297FE